MLKKTIAFFLPLIIFSCTNISEKDIKYIEEINEWHSKRIESLTSKDSWLSLAGLFWLNEGENSFGSDESNDIVFPKDKSADFMGWFDLKGGEVKIRVKQGVNITTNDSLVSEMILQNDNMEKPTKLKYNSLSWFVIKRQNKYGIRLKDSENPEIKNFTGIDRFEVNPEWKIKADFIPYDPVKMIDIPTVLGTIEQEAAPGYLQFQIDGKTYQLDPTGDLQRGKLFIIFADQTNGEKTYGAGRFLSVDIINPDSKVYIDFNKAYNPPCAFTKYATCPLPPKQNQLAVEITAGEKNYGHQLH